MRRTAADFADDAREEEYELELDSGLVTKPRSTHHFSYDEDAEERANQGRWFAWHRENEGKSPGPLDKQDGHEIVSPDEWQLRARFGDDYEAFWAEWRKRPSRQLTKLLVAIDDFYNPAPGSDKEKAAAAAGDADAAGKSSGAPTS